MNLLYLFLIMIYLTAEIKQYSSYKKQLKPHVNVLKSDPIYPFLHCLGALELHSLRCGF